MLNCSLHLQTWSGKQYGFNHPYSLPLSNCVLMLRVQLLETLIGHEPCPKPTLRHIKVLKLVSLMHLRDLDVMCQWSHSV